MFGSGLTTSASPLGPPLDYAPQTAPAPRVVEPPAESDLEEQQADRSPTNRNPVVQLVSKSAQQFALMIEKADLAESVNEATGNLPSVSSRIDTYA